MLLKKKLALGKVMVRVLPHRDDSKLLQMLRSENFGTTSVDGEGSRGPVKIMVTIHGVQSGL